MSMIGTTLGHYQITSQLGKGGMGEVYQAKDQKLGRDVAIKVLPQEFARDAERVARFQREAKVLASLNHPNIAAIYGLEESSGTNFLVLELVEGETLADRIKTGPIPVEESLKLALQIAEALEAAHEKGVIHRDLKPANIKVTPDGKVKVLDFGLAKAYAGDREEVNLSNSPTLSDAATQQGVILGTAAYMSPEQARGKAVDKRADIWAFGCVLFEMIAGRAAFSGKDVTDILAAVIRSEPEWGSLPANLHGRLREVLERCLKKDAKDRYHDISDVKADIQRVLTDPSGVFAQPVIASGLRIRSRPMLPWIVAILGIIIVGVAVWKLKPAEPRQVVRLDYDLPEGQQFGFGVLTLSVLAVSPDGKQFVYCTPKGLYLRSLDEFDAKLIISTETNPTTPFFSPDGKWIGYYSVTDHKLKKIAVSGGAPVTLCDVSQSVAGASWGADDTIVFAELFTDLKRVSANGGTPELIVKGSVYHPQLLPDGKSLMFTFGSPYKTIVQSLQSGERKELLAGDNARYISTGYIIYGLGNNLLAVPFDLKALKVKGGSVPVVEGVWRLAAAFTPQYAASDSGTLVYIPGMTGSGASAQRTLVWVDRKGKEQPLSAQPNDYREPHISPDGTKLVLNIIADNNKGDIWIWDLVRETMTRLTFNEASSYPLWSLDGKRVAFLAGSDPSGVGVYWKAADGTGGDEKLGSVPGRTLRPWSWSRDGKILVTLENGAALGFGIGSLSMEGDHKWRPLLEERYAETVPKVSPDGRWMAYMSTESGKAEVYVRPFPDVNKGKWQVSTSGGDSPLWSPNGRELFFRDSDSVMAVAVQTEPTFKAGKAEPLFHGTYLATDWTDSNWDISPDGKQFLMIKEMGATPSASAGPRKINIVLNWIDELKQRVPVK